VGKQRKKGTKSQRDDRKEDGSRALSQWLLRDKSATVPIVSLILSPRGALALPEGVEMQPKRISLLGWLRPAYAVPAMAALLLVIGYQNLILYPRLDEQIRKASPDLNNQIAELDLARNSLQHLIVFVDGQAARINAQREELGELAKERSELEPLVRAQREAVDELFAIQQRRNRWTRWVDYAVGFLLGICSSILAAYLTKKLSRVELGD
jgi:hypothetical protein